MIGIPNVFLAFFLFVLNLFKLYCLKPVCILIRDLNNLSTGLLILVIINIMNFIEATLIDQFLPDFVN